MEQNITPVNPESARKRKSQPEKWKRNIAKKERYSAKGLPKYPICGHRVGFQCALLTMDDIDKFHAAFYAIPEKSKQDAFILKFCRAEPPNPKRKKKNAVKEKSTTFQYTILNSAAIHLKVCRSTFLNALAPITKHRIIGVFKKFKKSACQVPVETRGGDHKIKMFGTKRNNVESFICSLKACESHYSRERSSRVYLPSELSIRKLWKMYNNDKQDEEKVTESFFRKVFCRKFNISFSAPTVDECSTCIEMGSRISIAKNDDEKDELKLKLLFHKKQAQAFFNHLREKPSGCAVMSFDCQKNLNLPKVSDQIAYYSRQLHCYNLSVVKGVSTDSLKPDNVSIYSWTEDEAKKSSNEVASIVFNELNSIDLSGCNSVRLVADGCAGQNKNVNMLTMCLKWLATCAPRDIMTLSLIFPVTGHSFLPSDRVFGLIERDIKKKQSIINKEEYHKIFERYGQVKLIDRDWKPLDWKAQAKQFVKTASQLHFKISQCKRVVLRKTKHGKIVIRGELAYNTDTAKERLILKGAFTAIEINPPNIPIGVPVQAEKLKDVGNLVEKHFGKDWRTIPALQWYANLLDKTSSNVESLEEVCECFEMQEELNEEDVLIPV